MKNYPHFIITFFLFCISFYAQSMVIKDIKKPVSVAWISDHEYVIGGKNGCIRAQYSENAPLLNKKIVTEEKVGHITINNNRTLLGLSLLTTDKISRLQKVRHALYRTATDSLLFISDSSYDTYTPIVFSATDDFLFICTGDKLTQYNHITGKTEQYSHKWKKFSPLFINYHTIKNRLLYLSGSKNLRIYEVNPSYLNPKTKILLDVCVDTVEYSPNGMHILFKTGDHSYFICALNNYQNNSKGHKDIQAHQLIHDNQRYVACAFHPKESIIALLLIKGHIQYFNYITKQCIASTHQYQICHHIDYEVNKSERLNICPQGKKLIAALDDECIIIDMPQNNVLDAYKWLLRKEIPSELRKYIFSLLIPLYSKKYSENFLYFDLNALLHVQTIDNIGNNEGDKIESIENSEIIHVKIPYKEDYQRNVPWDNDPINNPARFLYSA